MLSAIDHVVVAVHDLARTTRDYEALGFRVTAGGEHAHRGSHNALIPFQDGSYLELIAFKHEPPVKDNFWWDALQRGEGLVDFALVSDDVLADVERLRGSGVESAAVIDGGRVRPDGVRIAWRVARLKTGESERLPFLIDDVTPHDLRVPGGELAVHPNGVTGIAGVTVAVGSLSDGTALYERLPGAERLAGDGPRFRVGQQTIALVEPDEPAGAAAEALARRGSGPVRVTLRGAGSASGGGELDLALAHGARFVVTEG